MSITESNNQEKQSNSQIYEASYLLLPSIPEDEVEKVKDKIEKVIENYGGEKIDGEAPFLRELAYEMSKMVGASRYVVKNAYIGWTKFRISPEDEAESHPVEMIKAEIEEMQEILRLLLVKAEEETRFTFASVRLAKSGEEVPPEESSDEAEEDPDDSDEAPEDTSDEDLDDESSV